jgi:hypothetical protein
MHVQLAHGHDTPSTKSRQAASIGRAVQIGLSQTLEDAGLDSKLYELSGALLTALDTPNAAKRWARGEQIFAERHTTDGDAATENLQTQTG